MKRSLSRILLVLMLVIVIAGTWPASNSALAAICTPSDALTPCLDSVSPSSIMNPSSPMHLIINGDGFNPATSVVVIDGGSAYSVTGDSTTTTVKVNLPANAFASFGATGHDYLIQ